MCLHKEGESPFARLPNSWVTKAEKRYDWTEVIQLLRIEVDIKDKAADASKRGTMVLPPLELSPTPSPSRSLSIQPPSTPSGKASSVQAPSIATASSKRHDMRDTLEVATKSPQGSISSGGTRRKVPKFLHGGKSMFLRSRSKRAAKTSKLPQGSRPSSVAQSPVSPALIGVGPAEFTLPAEAIELDILDRGAIPALIAGVLRGTNVKEFLERLEVLAYTGKHPDLICRLFFFTKYSRIWQDVNSGEQ